VQAAARHESGSFSGAGGVEIFWRAWRPDGEPRATVVLAHGASEHSGRYEHVAEAFAERGYSLWALDHRGHGRSGGRRVYIERFADLIADLESLIARAGEELPGRRPYLLGHSMGGAIATGYAIRHDGALAGLILSNPLATVETAPATAAISRLLSRIAPRLGVYSVPAEGVSKDPEEVRKYVEDPLNFHGKLPARTVAELGAEVETFPDGAARITVPLLIMYSTSDPIVAPSGSEMLAERAGSADLTLRDWPGLLHEILNEPERDAVIAEMLDWLDARSEGGG
jgi:alpha-beta hydrolase superfamily lysophospholipase